MSTGHCSTAVQIRSCLLGTRAVLQTAQVLEPTASTCGRCGLLPAHCTGFTGQSLDFRPCRLPQLVQYALRAAPRCKHHSTCISQPPHLHRFSSRPGAWACSTNGGKMQSSAIKQVASSQPLKLTQCLHAHTTRQVQRKVTSCSGHTNLDWRLMSQGATAREAAQQRK